MELVARSRLFDREWYLQTNPDVAAAEFEPLLHFVLHGAEEGRNPSFVFDTQWYRRTYPDAGPGNPVIHYALTGASKGYSTHPAYVYDVLPGKRTGGYSLEETPSGLFLLSHQRIDRSFLFERDWYLERYRNVAASGGDPLQHYLLHGVAEGCNPNRFFDTRWYLARYPDVRASGWNPLLHYIETGAGLGYDPHPFLSDAELRRHMTADSRPDLSPLENFLHSVMQARPSAAPKFGPYDVHRATDLILRERARSAQTRHAETMEFRPRFVVLVEPADSPGMEVTRGSLDRQVYPELEVVPDRAAAARALAAAADTYLLWLEPGDAPAPDCLYEVARLLNADRRPALVYFDHERRTPGDLRWPVHKPGWSPDHLETSDYMDSAVCFRGGDALELLGAADSRYDLVLRLTERTAQVDHIRKILLEKPGADAPDGGEARDVRAIEGRLRRTGRTGRVQPNAPGSSCYDVRVDLESTPLVSIVIPTAGKVITYGGREVDLLADCVGGIISKSTYKNIEFVIVDNGDFDRRRLAEIGDVKLRYVTYTQPEVNIAKKINLGALHALGDVLIILNDDVVPMSVDWIERMLAHLQKPHVGIVGAKLLYPDGTLQHVGMVACDGHLHHVRHRWPRQDLGYENSTVGVRNYVAITGAVSLISKSRFQQAGGYPEQLPIDFNDAHLCYTLRELGCSVVYEPAAELLHYHAVSAERTPRPQDFEYFTRRWSRVVYDPFYNETFFERQPASYRLAYSETTS